MQRIFCLAFILLVVWAAEQKTVPQSVEEARREIKQAHEQIKHAEELLDKGAPAPGVLERAKEKVKDMFSSTPTPTPPQPETDESLLTKLRHYFRPDADTMDTAARAASTASDAAGIAKESAKESAASLAEKVRQLFGRGQQVADSASQAVKSATGEKEAEGLLEKLRNIFVEKPAPSLATQAGQQARESAETLTAKIKEALGYGKEAAQAAENKLHDSTLDKIKQALGVQQPSESLGDKVKNAMGLGEPTLGDKVKNAMGLGEPSLGDKVKHSLGIESKPDAVSEKIKQALGLETQQPSLGDRIKSSLGIGTAPEETLGEKIKSGVKSAMGVEEPGVVDKAKAALGVDQKPTVMERLKSYFGYRQPTTAEKMRQEFDTSISQARANIEEKINALRRATGTSRNTAYQDLVATLENARHDLTNRADAIYDAFLHPIDTAKHAAQGVKESLVGETEPAEETRGLLRRARDDMAARISSLYDTIATTSRGWATDLESMTEKVKTAFGRGSSYLLQSSSYDDGATVFYVNDNGAEFLDATGQNVDKLDKLKLLNDFRSQYSLPKYETLPTNVSIQTHPLKRAHVLIKSSRYIDGNEFNYIFDDGQETLNVIWAGEAPKLFTKEMQSRIIDSFRQLHGLVPSPSAVPTIRATISKNAKKDEL